MLDERQEPPAGPRTEVTGIGVRSLDVAGLEPLSIVDVWPLAARLSEALSEGLPLSDALRRAAEQPWVAESPRLVALTQALREGILTGECLGDVLERYRALIPDSFRYAVFTGEQTGLLEDALSWYARSLFSSVPEELNRLDLVNLYFKCGIPFAEMLTEDLQVREQAWLRVELERLSSACETVTSEVFDAWRRGEA